jgi:hypothetical protein
VWGEIYNLLKDSPEFVADVRKSKLL